MSDEFPDYVPRKAAPSLAQDRQFPPRFRSPKWEEGQDYFTLTEKHGRPRGPFDDGREFPYKG